ncbi:MAG: valine--tRNA ligase [Candidatus Bathyarchaeota archaeon]
MVEFKPRIEEKRWNPRMEVEILERWEKEKTYQFNEDTKKPIFSIDTPPPYASGRWHVGGAVHYSQIDMVARYFRMKGFEVLFSFGIDRNGLPVEVEVEKKLGISIHNVERERFLKICKDFLDNVEKEIVSIAKRLGMSCDFKNIYRTDSPEYRKVTQETFIELWNKNLIYSDNRPTNWCPVCGTTIADAELEYVEKDTWLYYINFKVEDTGENITIATTRPELLCTCKMVIFNPEDKRYLHLNGKHAITPIYNQKVPIKASSYAKPEFGSGLAMICSFGDYTDIRIFRELGLQPTIAITKDGKMNKVAGAYEGLSVKEAREKIVEDLEKLGLLIKKERIKHSVPICWRSKNPVEFIFMEEYYLKQLPFIQRLKEVIEEIRFYPPESKNLLISWVNSIVTDWPISRRRFYGTEIPLWYCAKCGKAYVPPKGGYYQPWRERPPTEKCECGSTEFMGEARTFDTWMDSSISQLYILGYGWSENLFQKCFPCSLRPQGSDIVRTWLYYSILRTFQLLSAPAFKYVRISGMGLDEHGEAMHKSKGNIVWPEPYIEKYGADAFRLWGASEAKLGSNYRFSKERLEGSFRFLTKLWNVARFISQFPVVESSENVKLRPLDYMILDELYNIVKECVEGYEQMDFFIPANTLRNFVWNVFADHYVEAVKARAYNLDKNFNTEEQIGAWKTLHLCLKTVIKLLAPICPFITEAIWTRLYSEKSIHLEEFPQPRDEWLNEHGKLLNGFMEFNSTVWRYKKSKNLALNEKIKIVYVPENLKPFEEDLKAMHKIVKIVFGKPEKDMKDKLDVLDEVYFVV